MCINRAGEDVKSVCVDLTPAAESVTEGGDSLSVHRYVRHKCMVRGDQRAAFYDEVVVQFETPPSTCASRLMLYVATLVIVFLQALRTTTRPFSFTSKLPSRTISSPRRKTRVSRPDTLQPS